MNKTTTRTLGWAALWLGTMAVGVTACGPQDGGPAGTTKTATVAPVAAPVAAVTPPPQEPAAAPPAPVAPAKPATTQAAPKPAPVQAQRAVHKTDAPARQVVAQAPNPNLGSVQAIEPITEAKPSGAGAVVGGLLGGVVGNQFGKGDGKKAMTVVGAVGGAVAGHEVEKSQNRKVVGYRVRVQLDTGETRTFEPKQIDGLKVGDRVRVDQGTLHKA